MGKEKAESARSLAPLFGLKEQTMRYRLVNARKRRFLIKSKATGVTWITTGTQRYKTDFTDEFIKELHEWVKGHRYVIVCPNGKDTLKIKVEGQKDPVLMEKLLI